jgi:hypothetical protein
LLEMMAEQRDAGLLTRTASLRRGSEEVYGDADRSARIGLLWLGPDGLGRGDLDAGRGC